MVEVSARPCALPISTRKSVRGLVRQFRSASEACGLRDAGRAGRPGRGDLVIFDP